MAPLETFVVKDYTFALMSAPIQSSGHPATVVGTVMCFDIVLSNENLAEILAILMVSILIRDYR